MWVGHDSVGIQTPTLLATLSQTDHVWPCGSWDRRPHRIESWHSLSSYPEPMLWYLHGLVSFQGRSLPLTSGAICWWSCLITAHYWAYIQDIQRVWTILGLPGLWIQRIFAVGFPCFSVAKMEDWSRYHLHFVMHMATEWWSWILAIMHWYGSIDSVWGPGFHYSSFQLYHWYGGISMLSRCLILCPCAIPQLISRPCIWHYQHGML